MQFVCHNLIQVLAVGQGYLFVKHQSVYNGKAAVNTIYNKKRKPGKVMRLYNNESEGKEYNKGN